MPNTSASSGSTPDKSVTLIGLGNTGSYVAGMLARSNMIAAMTLIDRDVYEGGNLTSQDILAADVGRPKAAAQADRLRRINPRLRVEAIVDDVESAPLALLRADLCVACLDSRRARQYVNQACTRLGVAWIDSGVHADSLLARVSVYVPGAELPCIECGWDARDYELIEQAYPCDGPANAPAGTHAPAGLGGLAGALQVLECEKLLRGDSDNSGAGTQILVDAAHHRCLVSTTRRAPSCRFDHQSWEIAALDRGADRLALGDVFALARAAAGGDAAPPELGIESQVFVGKLTCPACGETRELSWHLSGRLGDARRCPTCGGTMLASAFDVTERLHEHDLDGGALAASLASLGVRDGDVVTLRGAGGERHFQIGARGNDPQEVSHG